MKKLLLFAILLFLTCRNSSNTDNPISNSIASYWNISNLSKVQVQEYDSLNSSNFIIKQTISDKDTIQQLINLLNKLPDEGNIMIKFAGTVSLHKAILFESDSKSYTFDIIDKRIKTPKTSFYKPEREAEREVVTSILRIK